MDLETPRGPDGKWLAELPPDERLLTKFEQGSAEECWPWLAGLDSSGHGRWAPTRTIRIGAHRAVYEALVGPIPEGLTLDHLCHSRDLDCPGGVACQHRRCVNPAHLEPVTLGENLRRGNRQRNRSAAKCTHALTPDNLVECKLPSLVCRTCHLEQMRDYYQRRKASGFKRVRN